ncbi:MAG: pilus assembly protein PilP [Gammaproteobacteria bacterium]|nr:pilus assembly protein PilP [Gammaproteobacteria bacterium]
MIRIAVSLFVLTILVGCAPKGGTRDLQQFTENAHKNPTPLVEPLPVIKPHETFVYAASELTDPFAAANLERARPASSVKDPNENRRREPLEQFPLDSLALVGTMFRQNTQWVIVRAPDGTIHSAKPGNYMGQNNGKIEGISEEQIAIKELVPGPSGDWEERAINVNVVQ